ncbi:MAG: hypothetical protein LBL90_01015 [Prevotellaceae bacterium]|nr:hypothetical protein [Prevotellaceae bacterium]
MEHNIESDKIITILSNTVIEFMNKDDDLLAEFSIFSFDCISMKLPPYINIIEKMETTFCLKIS